METDEVKLKRKTNLSEEAPSKKKKRALVHPPEDEEKKRLEKLVLGGASNLVENLTQDERGMEIDSGLEDGGNTSDEEGSRRPAWEDEDDKDLLYEDAVEMQGLPFNPVMGVPSEGYECALRRRFETVYGNPTWAKLGSKKKEVDEDDDDLLLRSCGNFIGRRTTSSLPKGMLHYKRLINLNHQTRSEGKIIRSVEFHPRTTTAFVAGASGVVSLFQVGGKSNPKLTSIKFERFPLRCCKFTPDGSKIIAGSNLHSHFYVYDMTEGSTVKVPIHHLTEVTNLSKFEVSPDGKLMAVIGRFGSIHLITMNSKEWIATLRANSQVNALGFNSSGTSLYSYGDSGEVHVFDVQRRICEHKFFDEGCLKGTAMAVSPCDTLVAFGSSHGVVNVYEKSSLQGGTPSPLKAFMNLVTPVTSLRFNATSEILAMVSAEKGNSVKLAHFPSLTVFKNFPTPETDFNLVQGVSFSPSSGYMSVFNNNTTASLYRLKHYGNY